MPNHKSPILTNEECIKILYSKRTIKSSPDGKFQDCWYYTGWLNKTGYGKIYRNRVGLAVHRFSAYLFNVNKDTKGDIIPNFKFTIESKLCILHKCDNPPCFNPDHLFIGTQQENLQDMINKGRESFNNNSKFTEDQVKDIRKYFILGWSRKEITEKYSDISYYTICDIINGRTWRNIIVDKAEQILV